MLVEYSAFIETEVPQDELIISRTDLKGRITYANDVFASISGYSAGELVGEPHSIVRHPDMPKSVFKEMWKTLKSEKLWKGYVKNRRKDGGYYWVYAEVSGVYKDEKLVKYKSLRAPIEDSTKKFYQNKYDELRKKEERVVRGVLTLDIENVNKLEKFSKEQGKSVDTIINEILDDNLF